MCCTPAIRLLTRNKSRLLSRLLKCLRSLYGKQCGPRSDCSYSSSLFWSTLFASILDSSVMLGNCLQQTTSADDIFRCLFFLALEGLTSKRFGPRSARQNVGFYMEQNYLTLWWWCSLKNISKKLILKKKSADDKTRLALTRTSKLPKKPFSDLINIEVPISVVIHFLN